jgi:FkbH-like protein
MEFINLRDAIKSTALLKKKDNKNFQEIKIAFLRNYTVEKIIPYLELFFLKEGYLPKFYFSEYDNIFQDVLNENSEYYKFAPDLTILAMTTSVVSEKLTYDFVKTIQEDLKTEMHRIISQVKEIVSLLSKKKVGTILVHNFETPKFPALGILDYQSKKYQVNSFRKLNLELTEVCEKYKEAHIIDIDFLQRFLGTEEANDRRYWHVEKNPYGQKFLQCIAEDYLKFTKALKGRLRKCLILDLDNTLVGGILGEDGFDGIKIGKTYPGSAFTNFQRSILNLYNRGIILGICSKNNIEDVTEVLDKHPDMVLRSKHFSIIKANWQDKATNITNISKELNIGQDSLVFVDDNPFEINLVKTKLPDVKVIQLPKDPTSYADIIDSLGVFDSLSYSSEDKKRTKMYQEEVKRKNFKENFTNLDDYLSTLAMELEIKKNDPFSSPRIAQLCQRTNQFNLTSKRYTEGEIKSYIEDKSVDVFSVRLKDKFGDMGIIGAAIVKYESEKAIIDSFLLSCRSLGRGVENAFLRYCLDEIKKRGCKFVNSYYFKTKKNKQVEKFFDERGFQLLENKDGLEKKFIFNSLKHSLVESPKYFNISI